MRAGPPGATGPPCRIPASQPFRDIHGVLVTEPDQPLATARRLAAEGRHDEAAAAYRALEAQAPVEAAEYLGVYALRRRRWPEARAHLERAAQLAPANLATLENLGAAYEGAGALEQAGEVLRRVLDAKPEFFVSRLLLGLVEHRLGRLQAGVIQLQWAFRQAQKRGFWLNAKTTQPWLRGRVQEASTIIARHLGDVMSRALQEAGGGAAFPRVATFIRTQAGLERTASPDPRQAPKKHYFHGLPPSPWLDPSLFPWARKLQDAFPEILAEYLAVAGADGGFEPFLTFQSPEQVARYLGTTGPAPAWNAFFFYRHGERNDENCRRCPRTAAVLDQLPLIRMAGTTPEICFSVLTPGSHILPHRGDSNLRSVVHLGLVVPDACALKVAGEARTWQPGGLLAFDDTYEHEAWNRSDAVRAVLLMDAWNPYLNEDEKQVLPHIIGAMNQLGAEMERAKPAVL